MLSGWTGNCGCELIDSETANILGYTGDENIPVERGVYKYILRPYDISGQTAIPDCTQTKCLAVIYYGMTTISTNSQCQTT